MSLEEFAREIKERLQFALGEESDVQIHELLRNNGTKKLALTILSEMRTAAPVIYLEGYYARYRLGESIEALAAEVLRFDRSCQDVSQEASRLLSWRKVQDRLGFRLINQEMNLRLLETMPHRRILDLAVTYLVFLDGVDGTERTIAVTEAYRNVLGVTEEQLYLQAMANQPRLQRGIVKPIAEMLRDLMPSGAGGGKHGAEASDFLSSLTCDPDEFPMAVITNSRRYLGAGAIFYPDLLARAAKLLHTERVYLLPSSIHEMIVVSAADGMDPSGLLATIREINETAVPPEERLSDSLYLYDCREERLRKI